MNLQYRSNLFRFFLHSSTDSLGRQSCDQEEEKEMSSHTIVIVQEYQVIHECVWCPSVFCVLHVVY